jgi:hypothetical protein
MTSPVAVKRVRPITPKPLSSVERRRIHALRADPRLQEEIMRARLSVALTPAAIPARDLAKTLDELAAKLRAAGVALEAMPHPVAALLQEQTLAPQAMPSDVGMILLDLAGKAHIAALRVVKAPGRPPDPRLLVAVQAADAMREAFALHPDKAPALATLILGTEVSARACGLARAHLRKYP